MITTLPGTLQLRNKVSEDELLRLVPDAIWNVVLEQEQDYNPRPVILLMRELIPMVAFDLTAQVALYRRMRESLGLTS